MPIWQRRVDLAWLRSTAYLTALKQVPKPFCCRRLDRDLYTIGEAHTQGLMYREYWDEHGEDECEYCISNLKCRLPV